MMKQIRSGAFLRAVGIGTGISLLCSLGGCLILAWALNGQKLDMKTLGYGVMAITFLSGIMGSIAAKNIFGEKALLLCASVAAAYFLILFGIGLLFFNGGMQGVWQTLLLILGACICVAFVGFNGKSKRRSGKYRVHNG